MSATGNHLASGRRPALTLLELLVVLTILIAIGGIVVSSFPGLLSRTQTATAAANVPEIDAAIRRGLITQQGRVGNRFDSLISGGSSVAGFVGGAENLVAGSLSETELTALQSLGISEVVPATDAVENVTFQGHGQDAIPLGGDTRVCQLSSEYATRILDRIWNLQPAERCRYLLFGIGQRCSLVGAGPEALFREAPIHFSDDQQSNPRNMYSRYLLVIELENRNEAGTKARYVGTAIPHPTGIIGINDQMADYYAEQ